MTRNMTGAAALLVAVLGISADARPLTPEQEALIKPDGKPVKCISTSLIHSIRVRDDRTIDFYMDHHKVYRNHLPDSCPGLGVEERFSYSNIQLRELCDVDIITVLRSMSVTTRGPSCGLGKFQPIIGAPRSVVPSPQDLKR